MVNIEIVRNKSLKEHIEEDRDLVLEACELVDAFSKMKEVKAVNVDINDLEFTVTFTVGYFVKLAYPNIEKETAETLQQWAKPDVTVKAVCKVKGLW